MSSNTCDYLICDAPFPPSVNALKTVHIIRGKAIIGKSKEYKDYQKKVFEPWWLSVRAKGAINFGEEVIFWTVTCPPRAGCDCDNFHKCFLDCLNNAGLFGFTKKNKPKGDDAVISTRNEKGPRIRGGLLRVFMANERHREQLMLDYESELRQHWLPLRSGPILNLTHPLRIRRAVTD